jgi:hypothetical protein
MAPVSSTVNAIVAKALSPDVDQDGHVRETVIPQEFRNPTVDFLSTLIIPRLHNLTIYTDPATHILINPESQAWAKAQGEIGKSAILTEQGDRALWAEQLKIIEEWQELGKLLEAETGMTVVAPDCVGGDYAAIAKG